MNLTAHDQEVLEQVRLIVDSIKDSPNRELVSFLREQIDFERDIRRYNAETNRENAEANAKRAESFDRIYKLFAKIADSYLKAFQGPRIAGLNIPDDQLPPLPDGIRRERCSQCKCAMLVATGQNLAVCPACLTVHKDDSDGETTPESTE